MMKSFREQLAEDIKKTFLCENEFAEMHSISDGVNYTECYMVVHGTGQSSLLSGTELRAGHIAVVLETSNVPENHSYGCTLFLDGKTYTVENEPIDDFGMTEILLRSNY
jgi:hypothetical protein